MSRRLIFLITLLISSIFIIFVIFREEDLKIISPLGKVIRTNINEDPQKLDTSQKEVFGFLPYWMIKNHNYFRYELLTTIAYFALHIDNDGEFIKINDTGNSELGWLNWKTNKELDEVINKAKINNVRIALTVAAQDNETITTFLKCPLCQKAAIKNIISEMKTKQVTDLNLDFEYQGVPDLSTRDQYSTFVSEVADQLHQTIPGSQLTVDTFAEAAHKTKLHDIQTLGKAADKIIIMAYDFHRLTSDKTGPIAPLSGAPDKYKYDLTLMLKDYLRFVPEEKIIMGVAYYGYDWLSEDEKLGSLRIVGNESIGYSHASYYGICEYHPENRGLSKKWDEEAQSPWFYYYDEEADVYRQCHYENKESLSAKYDFIKENNLPGVGIWALGYDGTYPELWNLLDKKFR